MTKKRFYCDGSLDYRGYGIFDLYKADKTQEDFWNEEEECYEQWRFGNYLVDETDSMLKGEEVCDLLNKLFKENEELKDDVYGELDKTLKALQEVYEEVSSFKTSNKLSTIYDNLRGLMEDVRK